MHREDHAEIEKAFRAAVNMTPASLETWLQTSESKAVGYKQHEGQESVGHHSGHRIVEIKHKKKAALTDDDYAWMQKTVGYVHRHLAQRPHGDVTDTKWRFSLMNWGHDPSKD